MAKQPQKKSGFMAMDISFGRVPLAQKALFAKHVAVMLRSGMSIIEILEIAQQSAQGKLRKVISGILLSVRSGQSLSRSFARYPKVFSDLFVQVTYAGESSGTLTENMENISEELKKEKELISKVKGALLYPIVVLVAAFGLGMVLSFVVLPKITPLFEGLKVDLPASTRFLIWSSHLIQNYGIYLFVGILIVAVFLFWLLRQRFMHPITHWILLRTPILRNIVRSANLSRFSRTLSMLLKSGVALDEALDITRQALGNFYYRRALDVVARRAGQGTKLASCLMAYPDLFPQLLTRMVQVGEESGKFEETLFYVADLYEAEVDNATKTLSTAIEPVLLIFIGLVVGFLALSIITPIYDITGNIKR